jgi:hypothetical protein
MLEQYSTPSIVIKKARSIFGNDVVVKPSIRKNKKYMLLKPDGTWVHFGQYGFEDYTKHHDPARREAFRIRNRKWNDADYLTPAWLSYNLLW